MFLKLIPILLCSAVIVLVVFSYMPGGFSMAHSQQQLDTTQKNTPTVITTTTTTTRPVDEIKDLIYAANIDEKVNNLDKFGPLQPNDLVIIIQVHDRVQYLKETIRSLSEAEGINQTLLICSHDVYDDKINAAIEEITFAKTMQIFYPFSIQTHPDSFPGTDRSDCPPDITKKEALKRECKNAFYRDSEGHSRDARRTQIKHHWWWKINVAFNRLRILQEHRGLILIMEEDHYVAPDFIHALKLMQEYAASGPEGSLFSLGTKDVDFTRFEQAVVGNRMSNLGLAMNRTIWNKIMKHSEVFCKYDDYNWDWTLQYILNFVMNPVPLTLRMRASRIYHIGICGTHFQGSSCNPDQTINFYKKLYGSSLFPKQLKISYDVKHFSMRENGGWMDPRDHALCMAM